MAVMRIIEYSNGEPTPYDGQYVAEYEPARRATDPDEMNCHLVTTHDRAKALDLPVNELLELWKKPHGLRADGLPNRPLTAFTVEIEK